MCDVQFCLGIRVACCSWKFLTPALVCVLVSGGGSHPPRPTRPPPEPRDRRDSEPCRDQADPDVAVDKGRDVYICRYVLYRLEVCHQLTLKVLVTTIDALEHF